MVTSRAAVTCTWKLPGGKVVHTSGVGKQTGKTGKASAAVCPTPALGPAVVTTKTLTVEVGLKIGVLAPLKMVRLQTFARRAAHRAPSTTRTRETHRHGPVSCAHHEHTHTHTHTHARAPMPWHRVVR